MAQESTSTAAPADPSSDASKDDKKSSKKNDSSTTTAIVIVIVLVVVFAIVGLVVVVVMKQRAAGVFRGQEARRRLVSPLCTVFSGFVFVVGRGKGCGWWWWSGWGWVGGRFAHLPGYGKRTINIRARSLGYAWTAPGGCRWCRSYFCCCSQTRCAGPVQGKSFENPMYGQQVTQAASGMAPGSMGGAGGNPNALYADASGTAGYMDVAPKSNPA